MHGFEIVMTGGSALSLSKYGIGDFGMITMDDLVEFCGRTADRIAAPIIADADDGGGNPLNVYRTVQRMEKAGAACVMIEDLYGAKHIAGYDEGRILAREAMVDKVRAAVDARRNDDLALLVRSDVVADGGPLEDALERVTSYAEAGGDVIFVPGIPLDQCRRAVEMAGRPILTGAPFAGRGARRRRRDSLHRRAGGDRGRGHRPGAGRARAGRTARRLRLPVARGQPAAGTDRQRGDRQPRPRVQTPTGRAGQ